MGNLGGWAWPIVMQGGRGLLGEGVGRGFLFIRETTIVVFLFV